jgi:hypothetical protein
MQRVIPVLLLLAATTLLAEDSPLVAAAKSRRNAKQKAKVVITNDTLSKSGGHISTTAHQAPIALPKESPTTCCAEAQVKVIGTEAKTTEKPKTQQTVPPRVDDAERAGEGPINPDEWDYMYAKAPVHILPKGMTPIEPQRSNKGIEPQVSQKPH